MNDLEETIYEAIRTHDGDGPLTLNFCKPDDGDIAIANLLREGRIELTSHGYRVIE